MTSAFRSRFLAALGSVDASRVTVWAEAPRLFQLTPSIVRASADAMDELARRDPGVWMERGNRTAMAGPDATGHSVLLCLLRTPVFGGPACASDMSEWWGSAATAEDAAVIVREFLRDPMESSLERVARGFPDAGFAR